MRAAHGNVPEALISKIRADVARQLGFYVYLYVDPRNGKPFYVGKGKRNRVLSHLTAADGWNRAGATRYRNRSRNEVSVPGRVEFVGALAPEHVRRRYQGRLVASYFRQGQQSSVIYVNC